MRSSRSLPINLSWSGRTLTNSDGREVHVRDIAEQHVLEDLGCIPSLSDWLREMPSKPWMAGSRKVRLEDLQIVPKSHD